MQDAIDIMAAGGKKQNDATGHMTPRRAVRLCSAAFVVVCASATMSVSQDVRTEAASAETVVRFLPKALVTSDRIRLSDIATVEGDNKDIAAAWLIATAPKAGGSLTFGVPQVQSALEQRGVDLSTWVFRGHSECVVSRIAGSPHASIQSAAAPEKAGAVGRRPVQASASRPAGASAEKPPEANPDTLEGQLRAFIFQRLANVSGAPVIRFNPGVTRLLSLSRPTYHFQIVDRSERLLGPTPLEVTVFEKEQVKQVVQVLADVSLKKPVVITARAINSGETLESGDLVVQDRAFDRIDDIGLSDAAPLIGQRSRHFIKQGAMVFARDIEAIPLVQRNDIVTVWVRRGALVIKSSAVAVRAGGYGDLVELKNDSSKQSFMGVVTGLKTVELPRADRAPAVVEASAKEKS